MKSNYINARVLVSAAVALTQEGLNKLAKNILDGIKNKPSDRDVFANQPDEQKMLKKISLVLPITIDQSKMEITPDIEYLAHYDPETFTIGVHPALLRQDSKGVKALLRKMLTHEILHYIDQKIANPFDFAWASDDERETWMNDAHKQEFWKDSMRKCGYAERETIRLEEMLVLFPDEESRKTFMTEKIKYLEDQASNNPDENIRKELFDAVQSLSEPKYQAKILNQVSYMARSGVIHCGVDLNNLSSSGYDFDMESIIERANRKIIKGPRGGEYSLIDPSKEDTPENREYITSSSQRKPMTLDRACELAGDIYLGNFPMSVYSLKTLFWGRKVTRIPDRYVPVLWETSPGKVAVKKPYQDKVSDFGKRYTDAAKFTDFPQYADFVVWECTENNFELIEDIDKKFYLKKGRLSLWGKKGIR
jgi:hypothetical protein